MPDIRLKQNLLPKILLKQNVLRRRGDPPTHTGTGSLRSYSEIHFLGYLWVRSFIFLDEWSHTSLPCSALTTFSPIGSKLFIEKPSNTAEYFHRFFFYPDSWWIQQSVTYTGVHFRGIVTSIYVLHGSMGILEFSPPHSFLKIEINTVILDLNFLSYSRSIPLLITNTS